MRLLFLFGLFVRLGGDPDAVARAWAGRRSFRLDGAADLAGAVAILRELADEAAA